MSAAPHRAAHRVARVERSDAALHPLHPLQASALFGSSDAAALSEMFNLAFPLVGFSSVVVAWRLLARFDQCAYCYWAVVAVLGNGFNLLSTLPYYGCQLTAALVFGLVRTLQWAAYFHFLGAPPRPPLGPPLTDPP